MHVWNRRRWVAIFIFEMTRQNASYFRLLDKLRPITNYSTKCDLFQITRRNALYFNLLDEILPFSNYSTKCVLFQITRRNAFYFKLLEDMRPISNYSTKYVLFQIIDSISVIPTAASSQVISRAKSSFLGQR